MGNSILHQMTLRADLCVSALRSFPGSLYLGNCQNVNLA
jgi:hypothetical protein